MSKNEAQDKKGGGVIELVGILIVAIGLALLIQAFLVKPYKIPSESMVPTLQIGQRVVVNRIGDRFSDPHIGEIIVFHPPAAATDDQPGKGASGRCGVAGPDDAPCAMPCSNASKQNFVKRVVAGPGDTIAVVDDHVVLNGKKQKEPFIQTRCDIGSSANFPRAIRVPAGHWFMMGDNRECSEDSRFWGPVPRKWIIGGAFATYWPPNRIGLL
jgi:signal peptidase I